MNDDTAASAAIIRRLRDAPFYAKSRTAHAVLRELPDDRLNALALGAKAELFEAIFERMFMFPSRSQLIRLMNSFALEPKVTEWRETVTKGLTHFIATDPEMIRARTNWKHLGDRPRLKILRRIADHHDSLGGFSGADITTFREGAQGWGSKARVQFGWYNRQRNLIGLNMHEDALADDFDMVVGVLAHENSHCHQHQLAALWLRGRLDADAPEAPLARIFAANIRRSQELLSTGVYDLYFAQPVEQHARGIGFGVTRALKRQKAEAALRQTPPAPQPATPPKAPPAPQR